jgi:uncharacterized protein YqgV (UPF0045/DUF77 family)
MYFCEIIFQHYYLSSIFAAGLLLIIPEKNSNSGSGIKVINQSEITIHMKASVEISMYPLGREFIPDIKDFIDCLKKNEEIIVEVNGMSTQIFGEYRTIMHTLTDEIERSFEKHGKSVFIMKIINAFLQEK